MSSVIFKTPGLIDIRAFTTFGLNSKPNSVNPFGFFGTGLKYAVAVILREGCTIEVWIGKEKYTFYTATSTFRDKEFMSIRMKRERFNLSGLIGRKIYNDLPFTTELGKTWELWQAFRELESNTRDEGGSTFASHGDYPIQFEADTTLIVVNGDKFVAEYDQRHKHFLNTQAMRLFDQSPDLEVYEQSSKHVYYRGIRVFDLVKPAAHTYNILKTVQLTEDRTLKYQFELDQIVTKHASRSTNSKFLHNMVTAKGTIEEDFNWNYIYEAPSQTFKDLLAKLKRRNSPNINSKALAYHNTYEPRAYIKEVDLFEKYPKPWSASEDGLQIFDRYNNLLMMVDKDYPDLAALVVNTINKKED